MRKIAANNRYKYLFTVLSTLLGLTLNATVMAEPSLSPATPTSHQQNSQRPAPKQLEKIPDDIWSTIASPFDPIQSSPLSYQPPQMQPAPRPVMQPQQTPAPTAVMQPRVQPHTQQGPVVQQPRPTQYSTKPVPYKLPPQEKVVAEYPEDYWNCLLNNLQGVGSDVAAKLITRACQKKHPKR
ncbi:MAG TPA: hypothetical protein HPP65_13430 [Gammaproteobacteria bacterium]|nr:hypothetical protein [Gammaproteobacteria bacterium]MBT6653117.1 hypothetical protein [Gammaproteobacteria bacterium]MBT7328905.1 hypothetical protein [Gammaproteobacteria bacterium]HIJ35394.1 hypothetical protein [Gammaproteobacteria bacterium]